MGALASLLVAGALSVAACGESSAGDDGGEDGDNGGTSASGGTGGTAGTAGASTGGTSSWQPQCAGYCQRKAACPEPGCQEECESGAAIADESGCSAEYQRAFDCFAAIADPCAANACTVEIGVLFECTAGGGPSGCVPTGTGPANGDCVAVCQRAQACPDADPVDCAASCTESSEMAAMLGCNAEFERYFGCVSTCTNICVVTAASCSQELIAYSDCITCASEPSSPECGT